ncbi:hypothetical protein C8Q74DRAFT_1202236 [Fomes fomentarius]|nr:hypothetical protein C8Q74DRAFT_1202236 [Fomes fomentarius]
MFSKMERSSFNTFMDKYVQYDGVIPDDNYFAGLFDEVPFGPGQEARMYAPFETAVNKGDITGNFTLVSTTSKPDPTDETGQKMDSAMYRKGHSPPSNGQTDWSKVELSCELKATDVKDDPFDDSKGHKTYFPASSDKRRRNLGQIMSYATLVFDRQHRTHHFTVVILGSMARLIRWDRSGLVFTEKFNYRTEPHKLGRFLWCFSRLTPAQRGHDPTVTPVVPGSGDHELMLRRAKNPREVNGRPVGEHAREAFKASLKEDWPWFKMTVHDAAGERKLLVGKPNFIAAGLAGRGTRGYVAVDLADSEGPFVYLKDAWRVDHEGMKKEGDVLAELNAAKVPHIPTLHCHGDVPGQRTQTPDFWKENNKTSAPCPFKSHHHYRIVVKEVGLPLSEFKNGKQLIQLLLDCLKAHLSAYRAGYLHRDISAGNILIYIREVDVSTAKVEGLLTDWELAKRTDDNSEEPRQPDRTGTWQFTSVFASNDAKKPIKIPDELESLLYVLLYIAFHYLPHNCIGLEDFMSAFFDDSRQIGLDFFCGKEKEATIATGELRMTGGKPIVFLRKPLNGYTTSTSNSDSGSQDSVSTDASSVAAPASAPDVFDCPPSAPAAIPRALIHPINDIVCSLLELFQAYYQVHKPKTEAHITLTDVREAPEDENTAFWGRTVLAEVAVLPELIPRAALLEDHMEFGKILASRLAKDDWPEHDKQPDQVDPDWHKQQETLNLKRADLHEGEFETPPGKKPATGNVPQSMPTSRG